ncbi:hypothetical protein RRG08_038332 [Elysia crispata]|uniref:Uncharacterized protein n=1 Tax=Elysia crispata TaxID=231223 RepID=A0AAE1AQA3_9GAST|nr:hypothetical protein RRG08_038332 [Elysia crispata]
MDDLRSEVRELSDWAGFKKSFDLKRKLHRRALKRSHGTMGRVDFPSSSLALRHTPIVVGLRLEDGSRENTRKDRA